MRKQFKLDKEEQEMLDSIERGEWRPVKLTKAEQAQYVQAARYTLRKIKRINIRPSPEDLIGIQKKAVEEGIPYQTLIASIIHKYVSGRLIPKN